LQAGGLLLAIVLISPSATGLGFLLLVIALGSYLAFCRPPKRPMFIAMLLGITFFLPYFLLIPWITSTPEGGWYERAAVPWTILCRGQGGMLTCIATMTALSICDLQEGLAWFPLPRMVSQILLQIVHQTSVLMNETGRIANAMVVRGVPRRGFAAWRMLTHFPRVWLPRVMDRANRVSLVMELRGYCDLDRKVIQHPPQGALDFAVLLPAILLFFVAIWLRVEA
jgi:hypothetical protein